MAYSPTTWIDGTTGITATRLNNIEAGVEGQGRDPTLEFQSYVTVTAGSTYVVPSGLYHAWMQGVGTPSTDYVFEVNSNGWQPLPAGATGTIGAGVSGRASTLFSDGTNVRVRNLSGSAAYLILAQVHLSGVTP